MIFRELIETLESLLQIYRALCQIASDKKEHIMQNRIQELSACVTQETKLLKLISEYEKTVRSNTIQLQRELGVRPKLKMTLSEVSKMVTNPSDKQLLTQLHGELSQASTTLRRLNELNQQLLQQSLEYVNFSLDVMFGAPDEEIVYKKPEIQSQGQRRTGLFDTRA